GLERPVELLLILPVGPDAHPYRHPLRGEEDRPIAACPAFDLLIDAQGVVAALDPVLGIAIDRWRAILDIRLVRPEGHVGPLLPATNRLRLQGIVIFVLSPLAAMEFVYGT